MLCVVLGASSHIYIGGGVEGASKRRSQVGRILLGVLPQVAPPFLIWSAGGRKEEVAPPLSFLSRGGKGRRGHPSPFLPLGMAGQGGGRTSPLVGWSVPPF